MTTLETPQSNTVSDGTLTKGEGSLSATELKNYVDKKFDSVNAVLLGVVVILLVMVATLIIDSFHINSATYREYSEKIDTLNSLKDENASLSEQNIKNQELIIQQQVEILKLLNSKQP